MTVTIGWRQLLAAFAAAAWPLAARTLQSGDRFQMPASFDSKFRGAR